MFESNDVLDLTRVWLAAAGRVDGWQPALEQACQIFGCFAAQLTHFEMVDGQPQSRFQSVVGIPALGEDDIKLLYELAPVDPRDPLNIDQPWHPGVPATTPPEVLRGWRDGIPVTCRMFVSEEDLHTSEMYRRLLGPAGIEYTLLLRWFRPDDTVSSFSLMRSRQQGPFSGADRALLRRYSSFIRQAVDLHLQFMSLDFERCAAMQLLDGMAVGLALVGADGSLALINDTLREMLVRGDGLRAVEGRFELDDPAARRAWLEALEGLSSDRAAESISIERPSGEASYAATVSLLAGTTLEASPLAASRPLALVLITGPRRESEVARALLRGLYGLTPTETRVLMRLLEGDTQKAIAEQLSVSINTVKTHFKGLFRKTRTRRQAELVALVARAVGRFL